MIRLVCKLLAVTALVTSFASCSKNTVDDSTPLQTLRASIGASPQSLDPHQIAGVPSQRVVAALADTLLHMNPESLQPEPGAAESWTMSDDGLVYTFQLRQAGKWSDGSPVTAGDFVFSWQRILSPRMGHYYAQDFYPIVGAQAFNKGETTDFSTVGVKALDDHSLQFTLNSPDPLFAKRMTHETTAPVQPDNILKFAELDDPVSKWTRPGNMITNGPFRLVAWELNKIIELEKNPYYWDADNVRLEKLLIYPIEDQATEERMFRSGQLDAIYTGRILEQKIAYYRENNPDALRTQSYYATYFYIFNTQKPPFDNTLVRKALSLAVDREKITSSVLKAGQQPAHTLSPATPGYHNSRSIAFNPEAARKALEEAGYPNGEGFPAVTLTYNTSEDHRKVAIAIQQMWKKYLNLDIAIENQEWKVFLSNRKQHNFEIARAGSSSSYADPLDFLSSYVTGHGMNDTSWSNAEYDALVEQALKEMNTEKRYALMEQAEDILMEELPLVPINYYVSSYLIAPKVKGVVLNSIDQPNYKPIYIETETP